MEVFISSNADIDMCDWNGKVYIHYGACHQHGFYYMAEAEWDGMVAEFLKANFESYFRRIYNGRKNQRN